MDISASGKRTIKVRVYDAAGNSRDCFAGKLYYIDKTGPTASFKITRNTENGSAYTGGWINLDNYNKNGPPYFTLRASDSGSGIDHFEYGHDGVNFKRSHESFATYGISSDRTKCWFKITWSGQWDFYVRACDKAGNCGKSTAAKNLKIDIGRPPAPKINSITPRKSTSGAGYSATLSNNKCTGAGGKASIDCTVSANVCRQFFFDENITTTDDASGVNRLQYIWVHDGGSSDYCGGWVDKCGNFTATANGKRPTYINYGIRAVDNAGNPGFYVYMKFSLTWRFPSKCY